MPNCFVPECSFSWRTHPQETTLHVFPKNEARVKLWLNQLGFTENEKELLVPKIIACKQGKYRVCSLHFKDEDLVQRGTVRGLKRNAFPTLQLPLREQIISELVDHFYCKRQRLDTITTTDGQSIVSLFPEDGTSSPVSVLQSQSEEYQYPTTYTSALDISENVFSQPMETNIISEEAFILAADEEIIEFPKRYSSQRKKRKVSQEMQNKATSTEYFPGQKHKMTQTKRNFGNKEKSIQVSIRNSYSSIGIQCELVQLPPLSKFPSTGKYREQPILLQSSFSDSLIKPKADNVSEHSTAQSVQPYKEYLFDVPLVSFASLDTLGTNAFTHTDDSSLPIAKEEEAYQHEMEEHLIDPSDPDTSFIHLQEELRPRNMATENKFIVFESCLNNLLLSCKCKADNNCPGTITHIKKYCVGSALVVTGYCSKNHKFHMWSSQPFIGKMPAGNILISSALICSGCNFQKFTDFFSLLSLAGISCNTHCNIQKRFIYPTIHHHWLKERSVVLSNMQAKGVALVGDGQCDSPGFLAKHYTCTLLDMETEKILDFQIEKIEPGVSSVSLGKKAFQIALERLLSANVKVKIIATDRHVGIRKIMKEKYKSIRHEYNVWHLAKSIGKQIYQASLHGNAKELAAWVVPSTKHLLWSASTCHRNPDLLKEKWTSLTYHAANIHTWTDGQHYKSCNHGPILDQEEEYAWLLTGSLAHHQIKQIVREPKLLKDMEHLSNFCPTENLELYHSMVLKYRSKRHQFQIDGMIARTELAVLDHNRNVGQQQLMVPKESSTSGQLGTETFPLSSSKARKKWVVSKVYKTTTKTLMIEIMCDILLHVSGQGDFDVTSQYPEKPDMLKKYLLCFQC